MSEEPVLADAPLPGPFGVLRAGRYGPLLRSPSYDAADEVDVAAGGLSLTRSTVGVEHPLEPGETVAETYRLEADEPLLRTGTFPVVEWRGSFPCQFGDAIDVSLTIDAE